VKDRGQSQDAIYTQNSEPGCGAGARWASHRQCVPGRSRDRKLQAHAKTTRSADEIERGRQTVCSGRGLPSEIKWRTKTCNRIFKPKGNMLEELLKTELAGWDAGKRYFQDRTSVAAIECIAWADNTRIRVPGG